MFRQVTCLSVLAAAAVAAANGSVLASFENAADFKKPLMETVLATGSASSDVVTDGGQGLIGSYQASDKYNPGIFAVNPSFWDLSGAGGVGVDIVNRSGRAVRFTLQVQDSAGKKAEISVELQPDEPRSIAMVLGDRSVPKDFGLHNLPLYIQGCEVRRPAIAAGFNPSKIRRIGITTRVPGAPVVVAFDNIRALSMFRYRDLLTRISDHYGQNTSKATPQAKVENDSQLASLLDLERAELAANPPPADRTANGAWAGGPVYGAPGYFRTVKRDGRWWLLDPNGRLFFSTGLDGFECNGGETVVTGREYMYSWLPQQGTPEADFYEYARVDGKDVLTYSFHQLNHWRKYGNVDNWIAHNTKRLKSWGFNTIGSWADEAAMIKTGMPYVTDVSRPSNLKWFNISGSHYQMPDVFASDYYSNISSHMRNLVARFKYKTDRNLIGYFSDNELPWATEERPHNLTLSVMALNSSSSAAKRVLITQLQDKYKTIGAFNTAWNVNVASWSALAAPFSMSTAPTSAALSDSSNYLSTFADKYYSSWSRAIEAADPNHLYLSSRMSRLAPEVMEAAARYVDVFSFTYYGFDLASDFDLLRKYDKPAMLSEYGKAALDGNCFAEFTGSVKTQADRVKYFQRVWDEVAASPYMVGLHFYLMYDQPVTGSTYIGMNYNYGMVDVADNPYAEIVQWLRTVNATIYKGKD